MDTNEKVITVKELRTLLFNLSNQDMTVKELRAMLFSVEDQNMPLPDQFNTFLQMEHDFSGNE